MHQEKFSIIRTILKPFGLSDEAIDQVIDFISGLLFEKDEKESDKFYFPYQLNGQFITPAEKEFFFALKSVIETRAHIFAKIKLSDLFSAKIDDFGTRRSYMNRIDRKHVDFLLCDPKTLKPIAGIELDDKSHQRADRQERDNFVNHVFEAARLPLLHIPIQRAYSTNDLKAKLVPYLHTTQEPTHQPVPAPPTTKSSPCCPKCGSEMVLRTAKRGDNQGGKFWGCSKYPECRGISEYDPTN